MSSILIGNVVTFNLNDTGYDIQFGNGLRTGVVKGYDKKICYYPDGESKFETTFKIVEDGTGMVFDIPSDNIMYVYEWRDPMSDIEKLKDLGASIRRLIKETEELKKIAKSLGLVYEDSEDD